MSSYATAACQLTAKEGSKVGSRRQRSVARRSPTLGFMSAIEPWLLRAAAIAPERAALHGPSGDLSYAALAARARAVAGALRERGVRAGERVAIGLPPGEQFAAALHACLLIGAIVVPIDLRLGTVERAWRAGGAQVVIDGVLEGAPV